MTTTQEYGTALEPVEVVDAELVDDDVVPGAGEVAVHDPVDAVLAALDTDAKEHLNDIRPKKTKDGYTRDWEIWGEFHDWLAERTGTRLPLGKVTVGTFVSFVTYLDQVVEAPPNTIERRITGVTSEARRHGYTVPKEATEAARRALKPLRLDKRRQQRGRGKATAITPNDLRKMANAPRERASQPGARRRHTIVVSDLTRLRECLLLGALPLAAATRRTVSGPAFSCSMRKPQTGLTSPTCRTPPGQ
ncbi:hypothetical protein [Streptomyces sp. NPDC056672]|uniref:hypothetical protein n=1 Tax=Streptomyces sp. NPDC056672 TaxID=3345906 RepID=UPI003697CBC7